MKLYRFRSRSFVNGRIVEAGEELLLGDDVIPGAHMVDVAAESAAALRGEEYAQPEKVATPQAIFRSDLSYGAMADHLMAEAMVTGDGTNLVYDADRHAYVEVVPPPADAPVVVTEEPVVPPAPPEDRPTEG